MSTGFLKRSRIERSVINLVNSQCNYWPELSGLSNIAIANWADSFSSVSNVDAGNLATASALIREIAQRVSADSDSSKHVFVGEVFSPNGTIDVCVKELEGVLRKI